ncbi:MAG TPA: CARDB domain-containing protein [Solirubrobacteraceae bacterium]|nr:CARDB domain-containing protein [Solirubrobacteraceae bacterium]
MRRAPFVFLLSLLVAGPALAQTPTPTVDPPPLKATLAACASGPTAAERFALFTGSMPAAVGTTRMAMRFDLHVRPIGGGAAWKPVKSKGFGRWERSLAGKSGFVYTKRVERMLPAAEYRTSVRFRWYGAKGVQRESVRRSPVCAQPDQRPNLTLALVEVVTADAPTVRYVLEVTNDGATAAGTFDVALSGELEPVRRTVPGLPAGESATVELVGQRRCTPDAPVSFRVDPDDVVEESSERDNRSRWLCGGR